MEKHSFGNPVICKVCGQSKGSVWAEFWHEANAGQGTCDDCLAKTPPPIGEPNPDDMVKPDENKPFAPRSRKDG